MRQPKGLIKPLLGIPTVIDEFSLPEEVTITSVKVPLLKKRDATAEKIALLMKTGVVDPYLGNNKWYQSLVRSFDQKKNIIQIHIEMEHSNTTHAKIPIVDTGKFEKWKFKIQQYLQNEHYALWEVIEFRDSYEAPKDGAATASSSETLDQTFDRLQKLISWLEIQDIKTISLDDLYKNLKIYEPKLTRSSSTSQNPQNVAFVSTNSTNSTSSTNEVDNTAFGVSTAHSQGNYIPPKPDLMFIDEQVKSKYVDVVSNVASRDVKTVESKHKSVDVKKKSVYINVETKPVRKNSFSPRIIED
nr:hypothetical protein [Tanacetum cinerariifolium]